MAHSMFRDFFGKDGRGGLTREGAEKFPNPFCDIASTYIPDDLTEIFEWCAPAGTMVETDAYGTLKPVESLLVGDGTHCRSGVGVIDRVGSRSYSGEAVSISAAGLSGVELVVTPEHPVSVSAAAFSSVSDVPAGELSAMRFFATSPRPRYAETGKLPVSPYLAGFYAAAGTMLDGGVARFATGEDADAMFYRLYVEWFDTDEAFSFSRGSESGDLSSRYVDVSSSSVPELAAFGADMATRRIPISVFHLSIDDRLRFLAGWMDGSMSLRGDTSRMELRSADRQLAWKALKLFLSCGVAASFEKVDLGEGRSEYTVAVCDSGVGAVRRFMSNFGASCSVSDSGIYFGDDIVFRRIEKVERVTLDEPVYNVSVADTKHYTMNGVECHNCEYLMLSVTPCRAVSQRVVRYFLTEIVLEGQSDEERLKYTNFLNDQLHIIQRLAEIGDDYMCYGQAFISLYFPFDRFLICPACGTTYHIAAIAYEFRKQTGEFYADCGVCGATKTEMRREDRRSPDTARVRIIRWNPKDIRLRVHPISGQVAYYLRLPEDFVDKVLDGDPFYLNDTPWEMVDACVRGSRVDQEYLFKFREDSIYHMRGGTLAGLPIKGWAIPPIFPNFKLFYYVQLLRRYDEAIALDFIVPYRILFPKNTSPQGQDALSALSMSSFIGHMQTMINAKRKNITDIQIAPFEVGYTLLGGEAKALAPKDNIALALDELLNAMGFPADLYKGTLALQAFPVALRLFEKQWNCLVDGFNDFISWMLMRLSRHFIWGEVTGSLRSVTLADDLERKALSLQAAAGMDISKQTAYRVLNVDYMEEQRRVLSEQEAVQRLQQEAMARQQTKLVAPDGDVGPTYGATPGDVREQAKALANQLLFQTPETMRRGELIKIKHSNPTLHALVLQSMDEIRQDMARRGQAMLFEQAKTAEDTGCGVAALPSPVRVGLMISDQLTEIGDPEMRKIAMDIRDKVPGAEDAFRYVYRRMVGWE